MAKTTLILVISCLIMTLLGTCNSCNTAQQVTKLSKTVDSLQTELVNKVSGADMNDFKNNIIIDMKIEGLKTSKRMLYDNNVIIRTDVRPDDRMNEYDKEIELLQKSRK